ncbi:MAG: WG repeat-containing protein [Crocinitomicaceae bacterium]|nr:WG repeat-containing protein [Crocinitomicaceae bacterium]
MRLLLFFLSFTSVASAQFQSLTPEFTSEPRIYYFPFYNGIQLIEVDYFAQSLARGAWGDQVHPCGGSDYHDAIMFDRPNGYLVRNETGMILETFGVFNLASLELQPPNDSVVISHKQRLNMLKVPNYGESYSWIDANGYGYRFRVSGGALGILDTLGNVVIQDVSSIIYGDGEYLVSLNGKYAIYDSTFAQTMDYVEGTVSRVAPKAYFHRTDVTKIIDRFGKKIDNDNYIRIDNNRYNDCYIYSSKTLTGIKCGILRSDLSQLTPPIYTSITPLVKGKGFAVSNSSQKWALVNEHGTRITKFEYENGAFWYYAPGTYTVYKRHPSFKQGMIDTLGNVIIPMIYDKVDQFKNDLAVVTLNGKEGIVNRKGVVQGEIGYTEIENIYKRHVHVKLNGKQGIISHTGEVIVAPKFRSVSCFDSDYLFVSNDEREYFVINVNTKECIPCPYSQIGCYTQGFFKAAKEGEWGMADAKMQLVIPLVYEYVSEMRNGTVVVVKKGNFYGLYNGEFKLIKPLKYKSFRSNDSGGFEVY